jgi:hypothetical protein
MRMGRAWGGEINTKNGRTRLKDWEGENVKYIEDYEKIESGWCGRRRL